MEGNIMWRIIIRKVIPAFIGVLIIGGCSRFDLSEHDWNEMYNKNKTIKGDGYVISNKIATVTNSNGLRTMLENNTVVNINVESGIYNGEYEFNTPKNINTVSGITINKLTVNSDGSKIQSPSIGRLIAGSKINDGNLELIDVTVTEEALLQGGGSSSIKAYGLSSFKGKLIIDKTGLSLKLGSNVQVKANVEILKQSSILPLEKDQTAPVIDGSITVKAENVELNINAQTVNVDPAVNTLKFGDKAVIGKIISDNDSLKIMQGETDITDSIVIEAPPKEKYEITQYIIPRSINTKLLGDIIFDFSIENGKNYFKTSVSYGVDIRGLIPLFTVTAGTPVINQIPQISEQTSVDYSKGEITYQIIDNGEVKNTYIVQITVEDEKIPPVLSSFAFLPQYNQNLTTAVYGTINQSDKTIAIILPEGAKADSLIASFETDAAEVKVNGTVQYSNVTLNSFSSQIDYHLSKDGLSTTYKVSVTLTQEVIYEISSFKILKSLNSQLTGDINFDIEVINGNSYYTALVPYGTSIRSLIPSFNLTSGIVKIGSVIQKSGETIVNFENADIRYDVYNNMEELKKSYFMKINIAEPQLSGTNTLDMFIIESVNSGMTEDIICTIDDEMGTIKGEVPSGVNMESVSVYIEHSGKRLIIDGIEYTGNYISITLNLNSTVNIRIAAENGSERVYSVYITKELITVNFNYNELKNVPCAKKNITHIDTYNNAERVVFTDNAGYIYYSLDYGETWSQIYTSPQEWSGITFYDNGFKIAASIAGMRIQKFTFDEIGKAYTYKEEFGDYYQWTSIDGHKTKDQIILGGAGSYGYPIRSYTYDYANGYYSGDNYNFTSVNLIQTSPEKILATAGDSRIYYANTSDASGDYLGMGSINVNGAITIDSIVSSFDGSLFMTLEKNGNNKKIIKGNYINYTPSFSFISNSPYSSNWMRVALAKSAKNVAAAIESPGSIWISTSSSNFENWEQKAGNNTEWMSIAVSDNGDRLFAGGKNTNLFYSGDYGSNWNIISDIGNININSAAVSNDGYKIALAVNDDFIYYTEDGGLNWSEEIGVSMWHGLTASHDMNTLYAFSGGGNGYLVKKSGTEWGYLNGMGIDWKKIVTSADGGKLSGIIHGNDYIKISFDGGQTFNGKGTYNSWEDISMSYDGEVIAVSSYNSYSITTDGGINWSGYSHITVNDDTLSLSNVFGIGLSGDGNTIALITGMPGYREIYISKNRGVSWTAVNTGAFSGLKQIYELRISDDGNVLIARLDWSNSFWFSNDGGLTWNSADMSSLSGIFKEITSINPSKDFKYCVFTFNNTAKIVKTKMID